MEPNPESVYNISASWNGMAEKIEAMRHDKTVMDFKIHIGDKCVRCHRFVLALQCPVLLGMFEANMSEAVLSEAHLSRISMSTMNLLLDYMYHLSVTVDGENILELIEACDYLQMSELQETCEKFVGSFLLPSNVLSFWTKSARCHMSKTTIHLCTDMIGNYYDKIIQTSQFLDLALRDVIEIITRICRKKLSSRDALEALNRWHDGNQSAGTRSVDRSEIKKMIHILKREGCTGLEKPEEKRMGLGDLLDRLQDAGFETKRVNSVTSQTSKLLIGGGLIDDEQFDARNFNVFSVSEERGVEDYCSMPEWHRNQQSMCATPQGFALTGGKGSRQYFTFNVVTREWQEGSALLTARYDHASRYVVGSIFLFCGCEGDDELPSATVHAMPLHISGATWLTFPPMPFAIAHPSITDDGRRIYMWDRVKSLLLCYDPMSFSWISTAIIPAISVDLQKNLCGDGSIVYARGRVYLVDKGVCAWYHMATNRWMPLPLPQHTHSLAPFVCYKDKLLLLGGGVRGDNTRIAEFDLDTHKWSVKSYELPHHLFQHSAVIVHEPTSKDN